MPSSGITRRTSCERCIGCSVTSGRKRLGSDVKAIASVLLPRVAYDLWAPSYAPGAHNPLMRTEQGVVGPLLGTLQPGRALDLGTGSGRYLPVFVNAGAAVAVGLDFSLEMLARIPASAPRVCGDARRLPFAPETFDVINASLMAGDVRDLSSWHHELAAALNPGGHLVYSDFHPTWARNGWRRTFQAPDGRTIELPYVPHSIDAHLVGLRQAGLRLLAWYEVPMIGDHDPDVITFRRRWGNPPVLVVLHAMKPRSDD